MLSSSTPYAEQLPLRSLTPEADSALRRFFAPDGGVGLFLGLFLPLTIGLSVGNIFLDGWMALAGAVSLAALVVLIRWGVRRRRIARARFVYQYGGEEPVALTGVSDNWGYKVNGAPQQVISLVRNGQPFTVRTFNQTVISAWSLPQQVTYMHPKYPALLIPEGLFRLQWPAPVPAGLPARIGRWALRLLPFAFVIGLWALLDGVMGSHSHTALQPDAAFYMLDGQPMMAGVMNSFKAYEVSNKGTYGTSDCYAQCTDLSSGKRRWKTKLDGRDKAGHTAGGARLLGQSAGYLFFLRGELLVLDKASGSIVARNKAFRIATAMPRQVIGSYTDDAGYAYSDSLGAVQVRGTDGLYYTINGSTLQVGAMAEPAQPDEVFRNRYRFGNNYEDQITALYDDGQRCIALLDTRDTTLLANNPQGISDRPANESVRRMLVTAATSRKDDAWRVMGSGVYLYGGFLVGTQPALWPQDLMSGYASYLSLKMRYNSLAAPVRSRDGGFVILHKASTEQDALLLLTGTDRDGRSRWQVATGYGSIPLMYYDAPHDQLYIWGDPGGGISDELKDYCSIDLATGKLVRRKVE